MAPRGARSIDNSKTVKRTLKYLACVKDPRAFSAVIRAAPDDVIKNVCDAALNAKEGDLQLTESQKRVFRRHSKKIEELLSPRRSIKSKRDLLKRQGQKGGFPFLPLLLGAAAPLISGIVSKFTGG
jgi:ABC-type methionine transport system ATPase subunit